STVATQLSTHLNGTSNMGGDVVGSSASAITIPSIASRYIAVDSEGTGFRALIERSGNNLVATITGRGAGSAAATSNGRGMRLTFHPTPNDTSIFGYGMVTNGGLSLSGGVLKGIPDATRGSFFSGNNTAS